MPSTVARAGAAKVNLALHIVGRRADGYHLLDSIAVFAGCADRVAVEPSTTLSLVVTGPFAAHAPADKSDLAWRAAEAFFRRVGRAPSARIEVEKTIPAGAGLGGGSADAASVLLALNEALAGGISDSELARIGLALGADVPMCLTGRALRACGVGEQIAPVEGWPVLPLVLVWPGRAVSTAEIFSALTSRENPPLPELPSGTTPTEIADWLAGCRNDLEAPAIGAAPEICEVLAALRATSGCLLARMSGSGSACFGLYAETSEADAAAAAIAAGRPDWWVRSTTSR